MKRSLSYLLYFCLAFVPLSCHRGAGPIPKGKLAHIYAEMFLADERIARQDGMRYIADTSRVYAAIFAKYGYTVEDYLASQEKYIQDADRYSRILKKSVAIIEEENKVYKGRRKRLNEASDAERRSRIFIPDRIYLLDSLSNPDFMDFDLQKGRDTAYYGPYMTVWKDTLVVDTLRVSPDSVWIRKDSVSLNDSSLVRRDTLMLSDSL